MNYKLYRYTTIRESFLHDFILYDRVYFGMCNHSHAEVFAVLQDNYPCNTLYTGGHDVEDVEEYVYSGKIKPRIEITGAEKKKIIKAILKLKLEYV